MKGLLSEMRNVYGSRTAPTSTRRMKTREKIIAGIRLEVPEEGTRHSSKGGHGEGEGLWIYSFCDLIMNLLMFFVMMFAISSVDKDKFAFVQNALVSYAKKSEAKKEPQSKPASTAELANFDKATAASPADVMKRVRELLASIDVSKLQTNAALKLDLETLKNRIINLEKLVGADVSPDQDETSFQIVIAPERILDSSGNISSSGRATLQKLVQELKRFETPLRLSILNSLQRPLSGVTSTEEADAWRSTAQSAVVVASGLRTAGLPQSHILSAGGLGFLADSETVPQWPGRILIHVSLLREKPYIHRGKDSVK